MEPPWIKEASALAEGTDLGEVTEVKTVPERAVLQLLLQQPTSLPHGVCPTSFT